MSSTETESQLPLDQQDIALSPSPDTAPQAKRQCESGNRDVKPKFWKADSGNAPAATAASTSSSSPLRAPTPNLDTHSDIQADEEEKPVIKTEQDCEEGKPNSSTPDVEMEQLSLERKALTEPPSPRVPLRAPSPAIEPARPVSQSVSPPLRSPTQQLSAQHQLPSFSHQGGVSKLQSRRPKWIPHLVTSLPTRPSITTHHSAHGDKVYATASSVHSAHPATAQPLSPYYYPYDSLRTHGSVPPQGPLSAHVSVNPHYWRSYSPYPRHATPAAPPPTPVRTGIVVPTNTISAEGKRLLLVSADVKENLSRGETIAVHGKRYSARPNHNLVQAERAAFIHEGFRQSVRGRGADLISPGVVGERMEVDECAASALRATSPRGFVHRTGGSPVSPTSSERRAEASVVAERERLLAERERLLASRERELAEREHIAQVEREYERVYEERHRHFTAHPYYPRYDRADRVAHATHVVHSAHPSHRPQHIWEPRPEPIVDRYPIVYTTRPPRSITPRVPARSSSR